MRIPGKVLISTFKIMFEYDTQRDNHRNREVEVKATDRISAEYSFSKWIEKQNKEKPFKAYSNVKILECVEVNREALDV